MAHKKINFAKLAAFRIRQNLTQSEFWNRYGVNQAAASRYERDEDAVGIPRGTAMLIWLHQNGELTDELLEQALSATESVVKKRPEVSGAMQTTRVTRSDKGKPAKRKGVRKPKVR